VKAQNEIIAVTLNKIGLRKVNEDYWTCKVDRDGLDQQQEEAGEGAGTSTTLVVADAEGGFDEHMSSIPPVCTENYFARLEERVMNQLHTMHDD